MTTSVYDFRGILRVEKDGDQLWFTFMPRQKNIPSDVIDEIHFLLGYEEKYRFTSFKPDEIAYFTIKGSIVFFHGTWGFDDDDLWLEDLVLKPRNRYIKQWPSRPEPKEQV